MASPSSTFKRVPLPIRSGTTTTPARPRYGRTSGTVPVTSTLGPSNLRTSGGTPVPTTVNTTEGNCFNTLGSISLVNHSTPWTLGR